jgi:hypothetical protein
MQLSPEYSNLAPSAQTMVDIMRGSWVSALPKSMGLRTGDAKTFDEDDRVHWANSNLPSGVSGMSVLELGPLEAYHTYHLEQLGARHVTSVENNNLSFLKCLIVKELLKLKADFLYGDCVKYLETANQRFDLCWASGVLYHQTDPLHLLALMQAVSDNIFIWTHYVDPAVIQANRNMARHFNWKKQFFGERLGYRAEYFYRSYRESKGAIFSGGPETFSYWMKQADIFGFLKHVGFTTITIGVDHPHNPNGPAMYFLARR